MNVCMYVRTYVCLHERTYICMNARAYVYLFPYLSQGLPGLRQGRPRSRAARGMLSEFRTSRDPTRPAMKQSPPGAHRPSHREGPLERPSAPLFGTEYGILSLKPFQIY